jgi:hypothetical protein
MKQRSKLEKEHEKMNAQKVNGKEKDITSSRMRINEKTLSKS